MVLMLLAWPFGGIIAGALLIPPAVGFLLVPGSEWIGALLLALAF